MNRRDIVIGFIILAVVAAIIYFVRRPKVTPIETLPTPSVEEQIEDKFKIKIPEDTQKAELKDITGGTLSGIAARKYEAGKFSLTLLADLPDLATGEFYQAWLVRGTTGNANYSLISIGQMRIAKGGYLLDYSGNVDYTDYQSVIVSLETKLGQLPANRILEGSF
jgi:hypothetical protein